MYYEKDSDNTQNENIENIQNNENTHNINDENSNTTETQEEKNNIIIDAGGLFEDDSNNEQEEFADTVYMYSDTSSGNSENSSSSFDNSYEWDTQKEENVTQKEEKSKKSKKDGSSQKGFRVFLGIVLSVFTLSLVTLTAMVADFVFDNEQQDYENSKLYPNTVSEKYEKAPANTSNYVVYDSTLADKGHLTLPQIAAKCSVSSVGIISEVEVSYSTFPFSFIPSTGVSQATGSGFIYSEDGYIITNHHVIDKATKITVILSDKTELEAELVGSDELSDIAVLKVKPDDTTKLIPMDIGNSDELVVGETVVAIGCPAGIEFMGTFTDGIVSSINRDVKITDNYGNTEKTMTLIQTNATINHGNSGGPLINTRGQVIGINTLKLTSDYEGIGFSIPMNGAMPIIRQLMEHGKVIERTQDDFAYGKGIIGINGSPVSQAESEQYGIPMGVLVVQIDRESSAAQNGLRRGDIITHYNGKEVKTVDDINTAKGTGRPGEEVTVTVYRDGDYNKGETIDITFRLESAS